MLYMEIESFYIIVVSSLFSRPGAVTIPKKELPNTRWFKSRYHLGNGRLSLAQPDRLQVPLSAGIWL